MTFTIPTLASTRGLGDALEIARPDDGSASDQLPAGDRAHDETDEQTDPPIHTKHFPTIPVAAPPREDPWACTLPGRLDFAELSSQAAPDSPAGGQPTGTGPADGGQGTAVWRC